MSGHSMIFFCNLNNISSVYSYTSKDILCCNYVDLFDLIIFSVLQITTLMQLLRFAIEAPVSIAKGGYLIFVKKFFVYHMTT